MALQHDIPPRRKRDAALHIVRTLQDAGHVAYFAGGCVRDQVMGATPNDYDVATDAPPPKVCGLFTVARLVGEAFGVVMVRISGVWIEVATFRTEWGYADHRHPDHVEFCDAEDDARRRDFTVNGLFYDPVSGAVIDYVDGLADIERRVIRAIGRPHERFAEDYLRMLRGVRFTARLGFDIDPATAEAIKDNAPHLAEISRERIGQELRIMMEHPRRAKAVRLMQQLHLDAPALDEATVEREPICLAALAEHAAFATALAAWLIDRHLEPHEPDSALAMVDALDRLKVVQIVRRWRKALMLSNQQRDHMRVLLTTLPQVFTWPQLNVAQRKRLLGRDDWSALVALFDATRALSERPLLDREAMQRDIEQLLQGDVAPAPLITGDDLVAAGHTPGPRFAQVLETVYDAQLSDMVTTRDEAMMLAVTLLEADA